MMSGDSGTNQRGGWSSRRRRIAFTVFSCAVLAIAAISSCKKEPLATRTTGQQQPDVALTEPQASQQTDLAKMEPKRPLNKEERSCQKFVQEFYDWYTAPDKLNKKNPDSSLNMFDVMERRPQILDKKIYSLFKSDNDCQIRTQGICDLDFDPFVGSQDPSPRYLVKDVHLKGNRCRVPMMEERDGVLQTTPSVEAELERQNDHWVFIDFYYNNYPDQNGKSVGLRSLFKQWAEYDLKMEKNQ
jgi:hypothetical protein